MGEDVIEAKVRRILSEQLKVDPAKIRPEATFTELEADSLGVIELLLLLEDELGVNIPNEEARKLKTLNDLLSYLRAHVPADRALAG